MANWIEYKHGIYVLNLTPGDDGTSEIDGNFHTIGNLFDTVVLTSTTINTSAPLTGGGALSGNLTLGASVFGASGSGHSSGIVPDPGTTAGITHYLREDGTWSVPSGGGSYLPLAANQGNAAFVDATYGNDSTGILGLVNYPFATIAAAQTQISAASWTNGTIYIGAGTYAQGSIQLQLLPGILYQGRGENVTIITSALISNTGNGSGGSHGGQRISCIRPAAYAEMRDLTINVYVGDGNYRYALGCGEMEQNATVYDFVLRNVTIIGESDALYFANEDGSTNGSYVFCYNCTFQTTWDTLFLEDGSEIWYFNCRLITQGVNSNNSTLKNCLNLAYGYVHLISCSLEATGTAGTSTNGILFESFFSLRVEMIGGRIITFDTKSGQTNCQDWKLQAAAAASEQILILRGVEYFNPPTTALGATYPGTGSVAPVYSDGRQSNTLTVTSSTVTPWYYSDTGRNHASADASSLSGNTLTIEPPWCHGQLVDGSVLNLAISNTNGSSTAMTVTFTTSGTAANAVHTLDFVDSGGSGTFDLNIENQYTMGNDFPLIVYSPTPATLIENINAQLSQVGGTNQGLVASGTTLANIKLTYNGLGLNARNVPLVGFANGTGTGFTCTPAVTTAGNPPAYNLHSVSIPTIPAGATAYYTFVYNSTSLQFELYNLGGAAL